MRGADHPPRLGQPGRSCRRPRACRRPRFRLSPIDARRRCLCPPRASTRRPGRSPMPGWGRVGRPLADQSAGGRGRTAPVRSRRRDWERPLGSGPSRSRGRRPGRCNRHGRGGGILPRRPGPFPSAAGVVRCCYRLASPWWIILWIRGKSFSLTLMYARIGSVLTIVARTVAWPSPT